MSSCTETYDSLFLAITQREYEILAGEGISPEWQALFIKYPDRFMIGSDTWANPQWAGYEEIMSTNRQWLSCLPPEVVDRIAYQNAEKLFAVEVANPVVK